MSLHIHHMFVSTKSRGPPAPWFFFSTGEFFPKKTAIGEDKRA